MIDFQAIKQQVKVEDVISMLGLVLKPNGDSFRGKCPACNSSNDRALAVTKGKGYYCFAQQRGGDVIALVSHVRGIGARQAAQEIADHFRLDHFPDAGKKVTVPQEPTSNEKPTATADKGNSSFGPLTYLVYEHDQVQSLGISADTAKALGLGYAPKGLMRGKVAVPLYRDGTLAGYLGIPEGTNVTVPKNLKAL